MSQLQRIKLRIPEEENDDILVDFLDSAKSIILSRRFPFGDIPEELESRYLDLQIRIAVELYNKIGSEGETYHSEGGVVRTYEAADVSPSLLKEITPMGAVL